MLTNNLFGIGITGSLNVGPNAQGATLFVNSVYGSDNRGRVNFPGSSANSSGVGVNQGPQGNPALPLATLAYALSLTKDNRGDVIVVQEGHVETLAASVTCSTAGVTILGEGGPSARPQFTMAGFSMIISGAGSSMTNCVLNAGTVANTAGVLQLTGAGASANVRIIVSEATIVGVLLGAARTAFYGEVDATTTGCDSGVLFGVFDGCIIDGANIHGIFATAPVTCVANTNMLIRGSILRQLSATVKPVITGIVTATGGLVTDNRFQSVAATTPAEFLGGANVATNILVIYTQNYGFKGKAGPSSGVLIPAVGTIP